MLKREVIFDDEATTELLEGARIIAKAVGTTLGPRGRNVSIEREYGITTVVHDGVTVANHIKLDGFQGQGADLLRVAAQETNNAAGDGTTTAIVLAEAILKEGHKLIQAGHNAMVLRRGVEKAVAHLDSELKNLSTSITTHSQKQNVASISAQDDAIGRTIASALKLVGNDGVVTVDESGADLSIDYKEGMQFDRGLMHPIWVTDHKQIECSLTDASIFVTDHKITEVQQIEPLLEDALQNKQAKVILIADDISGNALQFLMMNKQQNNFDLVPIRAPGIGDDKSEYLQDIATLTGATFFSNSGSFLGDATFADLGKAGRITIGRDSTIIVDGKGASEDIEVRVAGITDQLGRSDLDAYKKERLRERRSKLTSGVAIIHVGGRTEPETKERKERVIDAIGATKAAIEQGIVPGGETALLRVRDSLLDIKKGLTDEEAYGIDIVYRACDAPFRLLVDNAGEDAGTILNKVMAGKNGYDVMTRDFVDMTKAGIVDPVKVTRNALGNASVAATTIMTIGASIGRTKDKTDAGSS